MTKISGKIARNDTVTLFVRQKDLCKESVSKVLYMVRRCDILLTFMKSASLKVFLADMVHSFKQSALTLRKSSDAMGEAFNTSHSPAITTMRSWKHHDMDPDP